MMAARGATKLGPFRKRNLVSLLDAAQHGPGDRHVFSYPTGSAQRVMLPPLATGRHMIERMAIRETPAGAPWDAAEYESVTAWVCEFRDALVHGSAGIIAFDGVVVADTLARTTAADGRYEETPDSIDLLVAGDVPRLAGCSLSLLYANAANYYHWTIDCLGRLAAADDKVLSRCTDILVPPLTREFQASGIELAGLSRGHAIREVAIDASVRAERLFVPWTVTADLRPHPCLHGYFQRLAEMVPTGAARWPRRFYIDRRGGTNRRLANEDEVIGALGRMGFASVRLEAMRLAEQIALFAGAEVVVAPHGAGLANLVYVQPGCRLIELHMDGYVNWCFRRLAAACQVTYDCVIGAQLAAAGVGTAHAQQWVVSITHMLGAVEQMMSSTR